MFIRFFAFFVVIAPITYLAFKVSISSYYFYETERLLHKELIAIQCPVLQDKIQRLKSNYKFSIEKGFHNLLTARLLLVSDELCNTNSTEDIMSYFKSSFDYNPVWSETWAFFTVFDFYINKNLSDFNKNLYNALYYGRYEKLTQLTIILNIIQNWDSVSSLNKGLSIMLFKHMLKFELAPYLIDVAYKNCFLDEIIEFSVNSHQFNRMSTLLSKSQC